MSRPPRPRYNFPSWNYGYTLAPPTLDGSGDYQVFNAAGGRGGPRFRGRGGFRGGRGGGQNAPPVPGEEGGEKPEETSKEPKEEGEVDESGEKPETPAENKEGGEESAAPAAPGPESAGEGPSATAEEAPERPLAVILQGRNPIMFCNDQSKFRGLHMEWEQVSETGPPHDKTFTWSLKMGEMQTLGSANSKKGAKAKAAEEMVKKLDKLPRPQKRPYHMMGPGFPRGHGPRPGMPRMPFYGHYNRMPPPWIQQQMMKRRRMEFQAMQQQQAEAAAAVGGEGGEGAAAAAAAAGEDGASGGAAPPPMPMPQRKEPPKLINPSQNNPISKLYEFCKRRRCGEPIFDTIKEEVLESRKTSQGFTLKKTEFTIQCTILGKKFSGKAMNKKAAKFNAAAAAWADIGAGVDQASISNLLQSQRNASS